MRQLFYLTLAVALLEATLGCERGEPEVAATAEAIASAEPETESGAPTGQTESEPPTDRTESGAPAFAAATLRQEELRGVGVQALQSGDADLAITAFIALTETPEPSDLRASAALILAELYHADGASDRAVAILERLIETSPPMAEFEFVLGRTLGELDRSAEAEAHLRRAIELRPELLQSYLYLGSLLVARDRPEEAADVYLAYETVLEGLLAALTAEATPREQRLAIIEALSLANPDARITLALVALLAEPNIIANASAVQGLAAVGTPEALEPLRAFAERTSYEELALAAREAAARIAQRDR